jgi:hypothetical protein
MYAIKSVVENRLSHGIQSDTETGRQGGSARCGTWQVRVPRGYRCSRSVLCCAVLGWAGQVVLEYRNLYGSLVLGSPFISLHPCLRIYVAIYLCTCRLDLE